MSSPDQRSPTGAPNALIYCVLARMLAEEREALLRIANLHRALGSALAVLAIVFTCFGLDAGTTGAEEPHKMSAAFERFRFSFFEDPSSARDGLDTAALAALAGEERTRAEAMLLRFLPDTRGVIGLGVLRSRRAEAALTKLLDADRQAGYTFVAKALWQIRPDRRWLDAMTEVLAAADEPTQRQMAAESLYDVRDPSAEHALIEALDDPASLVRYHAARDLLALHALPHNTMDPQHMMYRVMSDDAERRAGGKRDILDAIHARPISR